MESEQISHCGFICERKESWKLGLFETHENSYSYFLENKMLFARTNYISVLIYLKAIYGQKMKEIAARCSIFPDRRS